MGLDRKRFFGRLNKNEIYNMIIKWCLSWSKVEDISILLEFLSEIGAIEKANNRKFDDSKIFLSCISEKGENIYRLQSGFFARYDFKSSKHIFSKGISEAPWSIKGKYLQKTW